MIEIRWGLGILLAAFSALALIGNLGLVLAWYLRGYHSSSVPIVGGLAGVLGILVLPIEWLHSWFWVPIVADVSIVRIVIYLAGRTLRVAFGSREDSDSERE